MPPAGRTRETGSSTAKGDDRRGAILAALRDLLAERRFGEVTIAELTRQAGVTRPAFYFYFPSKAAAVAAVLEDVTANMLRLASSWYEGAPSSPVARLRTGMRASIAYWRGNAALFAAMLDAAAVDPTAQALWNTFIRGFTVKVTERIVRDVGLEQGGDSPSTPALATGLVHMTFALMQQDVRDLLSEGHGLPELESVLVHIWHHAIYGEIP